MSRPSRIGFYSESDEIGGAERSLLHVLAGTAGRDELVLCATSDVLISEVACVAPAVECIHIRTRPGLLPSVADHRRALRSLRLDLLQVTLGSPFRARPAMLAAFSLRIPTIAVEQLVLPARRRRGRLLKRLLSRPLAGHVAVGHRSAEQLSRWYGIPIQRLTVIHNGVPDEPVAPVVFALPPVVGCAARLEEQKGLDVLVAAMADVPEARLVLVGDGSERGSIERQAAKLGIASRLEITGWVPDARPAIAGFDVFALASRAESFPLTIVEAMLAKTPVVASDVGSVSEAVIDGQTGLLVPTGDPVALAAAIRRVLDDDNLRSRLVEAARALASEQFMAQAMLESYRRLWAQVLARRRRRSAR